MNKKRTQFLFAALALFFLLGIFHRYETAADGEFDTQSNRVGAHGSEHDSTLPQSPAPASTAVHQPRITRHDAMVAAVNRLERLPDEPGFQLDHPLYSASYSCDGLSFQPKAGGEPWHWELRHYGTARRNFIDRDNRRIPAEAGMRKSVFFDYGSFVERYLSELENVEQQFVIQSRPSLGEGENLVIRGEVGSDGRFEEHAAGWVWRDWKSGAVISLGRVFVYDADGEALPATMTATPNSTEITVDGDALLAANYPVTVDPEIGVNDFLISTGTEEHVDSYSASQSAVAFNPTHGFYFVAWVQSGTDSESAIYGHLVDSASGQPVGSIVRLSDPGEDARSPAVAVNPATGGFLVVWENRNDSNHTDIFGQFVSVLGQEQGQDFQISFMGEPLQSSTGAHSPDVSFNPSAGPPGEGGRFLVVWSGREESPDPRVIWGRLLSASGETALHDFKVSDMGDSADASIAANPSNGEFMVVFRSLLSRLPFGRRVSGEGILQSALPVELSSSGTVEAGLDVAYNPQDDEYLVVWRTPNFDGPDEIRGQLLSGLGFPNLASEIRISQSDGVGNPEILARSHPDVTFSATARAYAVVWVGDDDTPSHADNEVEVFGRMILPLTGAAAAPQQRLTHAGPDGDDYYATNLPAITSATINGETQLFVAWQQTDTQSDDSLLAPHVSQIQARTFTVVPPVARFSPSRQVVKLSETEIAGGGGSALNADAAYSPTSDLFLVVWEELSSATTRQKIMGQFLDGAGRETIDNELNLTTSSFFRVAERPRVAWNSVRDQFLVVFEGEDLLLEMGEGELDIFSVLVRSERDPLSGEYAGERQRISNIGTDGDPFYGAHAPSLAYNADDDEFLVAFHADDDSLGRGHDDFEIHCQRLDGDGNEIGFDDTRVSVMQPSSGPLNDVDFGSGLSDGGLQQRKPRVSHRLPRYRLGQWCEGSRDLPY